MRKFSIKIFKNSRTIHQLNNLYLRILQSRQDQKNITILLASCNQREGTTTIAVNLCRLITKSSNSNILFIDVNDRKPSIQSIFNSDHISKSTDRILLNPEAQILIKKDQVETDDNILFLELNERNSNIQKLIKRDHNTESSNPISLDRESHVLIEKTQIEYLDILQVHSADPQSPALSKPQAILQNLETLKNRYSFIILDAPPVIPFSDALYLGSAADIFLLIIEAEKTRWEVAQEVLERIAAAGVRNIAIILNKKRDRIPSIIYKNL